MLNASLASTQGNERRVGVETAVELLFRSRSMGWEMNVDGVDADTY